MDINLCDCDALVIFGSSESDMDLYYASRFHAPDPFTFVQLPGESLLLVNELELGRARRQSNVDHVVSCTRFQKLLKGANGQQPHPDQVILAFLRDLDVRSILVPSSFPVGLADKLRDSGMDLKIASTSVFPHRQVKSDEEIRCIRKAMHAAEQSLQHAISVISSADVVNGVLHVNNKPLTSEQLRRIIHMNLLEQDFIASNTIVAGGKQGCDPHEIGTGPLQSGETIIIDIFPRSTVTGYYGDITRTVVKGKASPKCKRLHETVVAAQNTAMASIVAGVDGKQVHSMVQKLFSETGYLTKEVDGRMQGFFHGTGHGLGLQVHETPSIGKRGDLLLSGHVVTIEPGLYYPEIGAVRIEDTIVVTNDGYVNLTNFPRVLEV